MTTMTMRLRSARQHGLGWAALLTSLTLLGGTSLQAIAAEPISEQISVTGAVKTALTLKVDDLKAFPVEQIERITTTRRAGDKEMPSVLRGVKLTALLERAGLLLDDANTWKHTVVSATAADGYQVVFSWPELFNTEVGTGVIVVFERDGEPLADREGRIALYSARDLKSGPRSVKWLAKLNVSVLQD